MEQGKTIKEIAEELGVSKTAVRKQIANLGLQTSLRKSGNQFAIEKEQETLIKSAFSQKQSQTKIANQVSDFANQSETSLRLVSMLQHELEIKNRELEIKNKQIEELNARLAEVTSALMTAQQTAQAAQALHAPSNSIILSDIFPPITQKPATEFRYFLSSVQVSWHIEGSSCFT